MGPFTSRPRGIAFRALQAVGASTRPDRRRGDGVLAGWPAIFLVNVPIGLAAIALTLRFILESRAPHARRFDPIGQPAVLVLMAALTFAIIQAPASGWTSPTVVGALLASLVALGALLRYEPRRAEPLIDLRCFGSTPFSASLVISIAAFAAFGGFLFLNTLYLQDIRGLSPIGAGLATHAAVTGMPREQAGVASAIATTSRQFGQTLGVAIIGAMVASHNSAGLASTSHPASWTLAGFGGAVLGVGVLATSARAKVSARRTATDLNPEALAAVATPQ